MGQARRVGWFVLRIVSVPPLLVLACLWLAVYWLCRLAFYAADYIWAGDP